MRNLSFLIFALIFSIGLSTAQVTSPVKESAVEEITPTDGPKMEFESMVVDYGTIEQNSEPLRKLTFVNTGTEPLVITNARGSCGCTVPKWSKDPIMPGESSELEVRYSTNRLGKINKKITITTNEGTKPHVISVLGDVYKKESQEGIPKAKGGLGGK